MTPTIVNQRIESDFTIEIGFRQGTEAPARVFKAMARFIDAFQSVDRILVQSIDARIQPVLLLENVEAGSIRTWLRDQIQDADDDALKKLDWKPIVGRYLVKAKYRAIRFLEGKTTISDRAQIIEVQHELMAEAEQVHINPIQIHRPIPESDVVRILQLLTEPMAELRGSDSAKFITAREEEAKFGMEFSIAPESIEQLITRETIVNQAIMILKVKRPDYLGEAMWDLRHEGHPVEAKILDTNWLGDFQERKTDLRPGDAIRADVRIEVRYGFDGEVVGKHYAIQKVMEIIGLDPFPEESFLH